MARAARSARSAFSNNFEAVATACASSGVIAAIRCHASAAAAKSLRFVSCKFASFFSSAIFVSRIGLCRGLLLEQLREVVPALRFFEEAGQRRARCFVDAIER